MEDGLLQKRYFCEHCCESVSKATYYRHLNKLVKNDRNRDECSSAELESDEDTSDAEPIDPENDYGMIIDESNDDNAVATCFVES